ncbi:DUF4383 domain-containing protein [Frigoribacterium faeni]|uniref:DUF4383 domain-containing protein n=1 Tax=Frigoribacterium faeni TaxID=145483 RepID=A0A7W3JKI1_9MICO|nr:DUF4383 domain-containing protein [Frigoribacterium faeni]MBA8814488.1 hypothetical protein [Frigoribacterium faeni]BFF16001.1 hypothetical protein GCM10025699_73040 [Microbacterium flavescens]GEK84801.1 hypothetical protein FFA01_31100 [Frigoribacterium faeni]
MTTTSTVPAPSIRESPNRGLTLALGTIVLLLGLCAFLAEDMGTFFDTTGANLLGVWNVNPALAVIWVLAGAALILGGASGVSSARSIGAIVGVVYLVFGVVGFFVEGTDVNFLAVNLGDNITHVIVGGLLVLTAIGADRRRR